MGRHNTFSSKKHCFIFTINLFSTIMSHPNLDKILLSDPASVYENYLKIYFDTKHLKTSLNRRW